MKCLGRGKKGRNHPQNSVSFPGNFSIRNGPSEQLTVEKQQPKPSDTHIPLDALNIFSTQRNPSILLPHTDPEGHPWLSLFWKPLTQVSTWPLKHVHVLHRNGNKTKKCKTAIWALTWVLNRSGTSKLLISLVYWWRWDMPCWARTAPYFSEGGIRRCYLRMASSPSPSPCTPWSHCKVWADIPACSHCL